jgi:Flp pilus assembly protein TadG
MPCRLFHGNLRERGAAAIEFAIVLPVLLLCVLGLTELARAIWTQTTLNYAVQAAARCAAVDINHCGTEAAINNYINAPGLSVTFHLTTPAPKCGAQVTASLPFDWLVPAFISDPLFPKTLTASACFPT